MFVENQTGLPANQHPIGTSSGVPALYSFGMHR